MIIKREVSTRFPECFLLFGIFHWGQNRSLDIWWRCRKVTVQSKLAWISPGQSACRGSFPSWVLSKGSCWGLTPQLVVKQGRKTVRITGTQEGKEDTHCCTGPVSAPDCYHPRDFSYTWLPKITAAGLADCWSSLLEGEVWTLTQISNHSFQPVAYNPSLIVCGLGEGLEHTDWEGLGEGLHLPSCGKATIHAGCRLSSVAALGTTPYPWSVSKSNW